MVRIDPIALFGDAWQLARRHRVLWILGLIGALSGDLLSTVRIGPDLDLLGSGELLRANVFEFGSWLRALGLLSGSLVVATAVTLVAAGCMLAAVLSAKAGLVGITSRLDRKAPALDVEPALRGGAQLLGSTVPLAVLVYGPYLLASDLAGEALRLAPGILKVPFYGALLVLVLVGLAVPVFYSLGVCAVVLDECRPRPALERAWQIVTDRPAEAALIGAVVALGFVICNWLAHLVMAPVDGVSLLSLLLTMFRGSFPNLGQLVGLVVLGAVATLVRTPAYVFGMVVVTLAYERVA
jgi:hypothetical protein